MSDFERALLLLCESHEDSFAAFTIESLDMTITTVSIPQGSSDDLLTIAEVSAILRVPVNTLRWWRYRGDGPRFFKLGRHLVTTIGDLRSWLEEQKRGDDPDAA
jgi:hypothetical protein